MTHQFSAEQPEMGIMSAEFFAATFKRGVFQPPPPPTGVAPFHLDLKSILPSPQYDNIVQSQRMVFHTVGDTGGVKSPQDQTLVAMHMDGQFNPATPQNNPAFFYHLGDVIYFYGEESEYNTQFYDPYKFYPAPIFAIPGNHDGDIDSTATNPPTTLAAFMKHFCAPTPSVPALAEDSIRTTMTQPNPYWTLVTPVANFIGLYTNVPSGGEVHADQKDWFINELKNADKERKTKALIVALHHPPYSMDANHGASTTMQKLLDDSFKAANVQPDMVLSGHVHNYQRFTRKVGTRQIPYIVAGAGGYWHLHNINVAKTVIKTPVASPFPDVTFEKYSEDRHGFMRITIDMKKRKILMEYFTVPRLQESWKAPEVLFDSFTLDLAKNKLK